MAIIKLFLTNIYSLLYRVTFKNKTVVLLGNPYGDISGHIKCCYYILKSADFCDIYIINNKGKSKKESNKYSLKTIIYTHNPTSDIFPIIPNGVRKINIWHGMPIKTIGYDSEIEKKWIDNKSKNNLSPYLVNDLLIVNSKYWVDYFSKCWKFPKNKILPLGSIVSAYLNEYKVKLISELNNTFLNHENYIIFAPTFRNDGSDYQYINKTISLFSKLPQYNFIVKLHPKVNVTFNKNYKNIISPNNFDLFDLFLIGDLLITDYSSVFYEYLSVQSNCILFQPDKDEYERINGKLNLLENHLGISFARNELELKNKIDYLMNDLKVEKKYINRKFDIVTFINNIG